MAQARRKRMTALLTAVLLLAGLLPIAADSPDSPEPRTAKGEQRYAASSFQFDGDAVYDEAEQALKVSGSARLRLSLRTEQVGNYTMALEYRLDAQGGKPAGASAVGKRRCPCRIRASPRVQGCDGRDVRAG